MLPTGQDAAHTYSTTMMTLPRMDSAGQAASHELQSTSHTDPMQQQCKEQLTSQTHMALLLPLPHALQHSERPSSNNANNGTGCAVGCVQQPSAPRLLTPHQKR